MKNPMQARTKVDGSGTPTAGVLLPGGAVDPVGDELAVEEILAEMDALLADDSIPGFEVIDPWVGELETDIENGAS